MVSCSIKKNMFPDVSKLMEGVRNVRGAYSFCQKTLVYLLIQQRVTSLTLQYTVTTNQKANKELECDGEKIQLLDGFSTCAIGLRKLLLKGTTVSYFKFF